MILTYFFLYNLSLLVLLWSILNIYLLRVKTLNLFSFLNTKPFILFTLSVIILSLAGVPPFIGFFSKLFILQLVLNSKFFLFIVVFFVNLLFSLYFYVQNLKYLHTITYPLIPTPHILTEERSVLVYPYFTILVLFTVVAGFNFIDDILLILLWVSN